MMAMIAFPVALAATIVFSGDGSVSSLKSDDGRELVRERVPFVSVDMPDGREVCADSLRRSGDRLVFGFPGGLGECVVSMKGFGDGVGYMLDISRDKVPTMDTLKTMVDVLAAAGFARKAAGELPAETLAGKMVDQINELKKEGAKCQ